MELLLDYGIKSFGKSPYAQVFINPLKARERIVVISGLPGCDAYGQTHELAWADKGGLIGNGNNIFHARINGLNTELIALSDQPGGAKKDDLLRFRPQLFIGGAEVKPVSETPKIINDPLNENYTYNTLEWDYGVCLRRIRLIEGRFLGSWVFAVKPGGDVLIRYNQSGVFRLRLQHAIDADTEFVTRTYFDDAETWPVTISDSLTFYPDASPETSSVDGYTMDYNNDMTWANLIAEPGNYAHDGQVYDSIIIRASATSAQWAQLNRKIHLFDTSALADDAVITGATLSIYGRSSVDGLSINPDINVYSSNPASNTALVAGDFDSLGATAFCDTPILRSEFLTSYNDFILNAAGLAVISKTGISKFGFRNANYDVAATTPANWVSNAYSSFEYYNAEQGAGYQPKLVVTYSTGGVDYPIATTSNLSANPNISRGLTYTRATSTGLTSSPNITKTYSGTRTTSSNLSIGANVTRTSARTRNTTSNLSSNSIISRKLASNKSTTTNLSLNPIITRTLTFTRATTSNLSFFVSVVIPTAVSYLITTTTNLSLNPSVIRAITCTRSLTTSLSMACSITASQVLNYIARRFLKTPTTTYGSDISKTGRYGSQS